jgi:hypothetical protein
MRFVLFVGVVAWCLALPDTSHAQLSPSASWAAHAANQYRVVPDLLDHPAIPREERAFGRVNQVRLKPDTTLSSIYVVVHLDRVLTQA